MKRFCYWSDDEITTLVCGALCFLSVCSLLTVSIAFAFVVKFA